MPCVHRLHHQLVFAAELIGRLADHHGAADLRELAAIARRDLGQDDVALLAACGRSRAAPRGCADRRTAAGNCPRRRASSCSHLSATASSSSLMPGRAICEQMLVAELGDARRLAGVGDLVGGLGAGGVEHELVGRARSRQRRGDAGLQSATAGTAGRRCRPGRAAAASRRARVSSAVDQVIGADHATPAGTARAARSASQGGVTIRLHVPSRSSSAAAGAERLEAGQHRHRIGLLDEMRAVMQRRPGDRASPPACGGRCRRGARGSSSDRHCSRDGA